MSTIETKNIVKRFEGVHALDDLSVAFKHGTVTGVVGPNGSGKTTLINVLSGMLPFDNGTLRVKEKEVSALKPHRISEYGITRSFQESRLFEQMTVLDNILVVVTERRVIGSLFRRQQKKCEEKAKQVLQAVGLWEKRDDLAFNLSYGQRKLLEIARVLAVQAEVYLFDEPFAGLFPAMVKTVTAIIKDLKKQGKSIVLIEHNMDIIRNLSDWVIVMDEGKLLAQGAPNEVFEKREVVAVYVGK